MSRYSIALLAFITLASAIILLAFRVPAWSTPASTPSRDSPGAPTAPQFVEVKFKEKLRIRLYALDTAAGRESKVGVTASGIPPARARFRGLNDPESLRLSRLFQAYSVQAIVPRATEDEADRMTRELGTNAPDIGSWYRIVLPSDADVNSFVQALKQLPSVDTALPAPMPMGF